MRLIPFLIPRQISVGRRSSERQKFTHGQQMAVYGSTPQEAETKLKDLLELTDAALLTLSVTAEKDRNPKLKKNATRMYPAHGTMLVRRSSIDLQGRTDLEGNTWEDEHIRFDLWCEAEPPEFADVSFTGAVCVVLKNKSFIKSFIFTNRLHKVKEEERSVLESF